MLRTHTPPGQKNDIHLHDFPHVKSANVASALEGARFGTWWDRMVVRLIFSSACVAAGYHFHPFGLSPSGRRTGGAFVFAVGFSL